MNLLSTLASNNIQIRKAASLAISGILNMIFLIKIGIIFLIFCIVLVKMRIFLYNYLLLLL